MFAGHIEVPGGPHVARRPDVAQAWSRTTKIKKTIEKFKLREDKLDPGRLWVPYSCIILFFGDEFYLIFPYLDRHFSICSFFFSVGLFRLRHLRLSHFRLGHFRLGYFRLGSFRLGPFRLGPFRLGPFRLGPFRLGHFILGQFRLRLLRLGLFILGPFRLGLHTWTPNICS